MFLGRIPSKTKKIFIFTRLTTTMGCPAPEVEPVVNLGHQTAWGLTFEHVACTLRVRFK